jgi:hypothetical protein
MSTSAKFAKPLAGVTSAVRERPQKIKEEYRASGISDGSWRSFPEKTTNSYACPIRGSDREFLFGAYAFLVCVPPPVPRCND